MSEPVISAMEFLRKLQRLLNEGDFVATYKYALLNALADLSLERPAATDGSLRLPLDGIAEKFIEYYWRQARPYRALDGNGFVLLQNTGSQAAVINEIARLQRHHATLASAREGEGWAALVARIARTVEEMPLWRLQTVGRDADEFLYRRADFHDGAIRLLPGVPEAFRALYGLVLDAVRGAWVRQVHSIRSNLRVLGDSDLASFLFGTERGALADFSQVLREHQAGRCLYCRREVRTSGCVDHFVAWSRYPVDLGHNLVLAHARCNAQKRDFLAHPRHVERWRAIHLERATELAERFDQARLPHDAARTRSIARWAYEQGEAAGAHVWVRDNEVEKLGHGWRAALEPAGCSRAAESSPPSYGS